MYGMCPTNGGGADFRQAIVANLAFANQILQCADDIFDRHVQVNPVLIEQVDIVRPQAFQRGFRDCTNGCRTAVSADDAAVLQLEAKLGGNDQVFSIRSQGFAQQNFVGVRAVSLRRVEEVDPAFNCGMQHLDADALIYRFAGTETQIHRPHTQG